MSHVRKVLSTSYIPAGQPEFIIAMPVHMFEVLVRRVQKDLVEAFRKDLEAQRVEEVAFETTDTMSDYQRGYTEALDLAYLNMKFNTPTT